MSRPFALRYKYYAFALVALATGPGDVAAVAQGVPAPPKAAAQAPAATAHPDLSGIWEPLSGAMKPLDKPALTPRALKELAPTLTPGEAKWAENGIGEDDANCLPRRQPWMLTQSAPITIVHDGDKLILLYEKRSAPMHVYIDGRKHPEDAVSKPSLNGHSVGHWEGNELVVDSIGFAEHPGHGPFKELPYLPGLRITQRFHLEKNGQELHARFTIDDPELFEKPYVYDFAWHRLPYATNYALVEICDARDPNRLKY